MMAIFLNQDLQDFRMGRMQFDNFIDFKHQENPKILQILIQTNSLLRHQPRYHINT
jgi:hypothetical protein